jgi:hypothetical protein
LHGNVQELEEMRRVRRSRRTSYSTEASKSVTLPIAPVINTSKAIEKQPELPLVSTEQGTSANESKESPEEMSRPITNSPGVVAKARERFGKEHEEAISTKSLPKDQGKPAVAKAFGVEKKEVVKENMQKVK